MELVSGDRFLFGVQRPKEIEDLMSGFGGGQVADEGIQRLLRGVRVLAVGDFAATLSGLAAALALGYATEALIGWVTAGLLLAGRYALRARYCLERASSHPRGPGPR